MRIIVCGSRTFTDRRVVHTMLNGLRPNGRYPLSLTLVEGGGAGADRLAGDWADAQDDVEHVRVPANWELEGRSAGPRRNQRMLDEHGPIDLVVAFVDKPLEKSRGTFDMVRRARGARVPTWVIEVQPTAG